MYYINNSTKIPEAPTAPEIIAFVRKPTNVMASRILLTIL